MQYSSGFIGDFKLGDNIVHNLSILRELYAIQSSNHNAASLLRKPIIVFIGALAEALLYDLYVVKAATFTSEGVPNIPADVLDDIRNKKIDEFGKYISHARKQALLGSDNPIYNDLDELRKLRNRVHIQNTKRHFEPDERKAFTRSRQLMAERTLESLISIMVANHMRREQLHSVADLELPWSSHL